MDSPSSTGFAVAPASSSSSSLWPGWLPGLGPALCLSLCLASVSGCRKTDDDGGTAGMVNLMPSMAGAHGCVGPDQVFSGACAPCVQSVGLATLDLGPNSQIAASGATEIVYATGQNGQLVQLDFSGAGVAELELLSAGELDTFLTSIGGSTPGELSGVCVLPSFDLVLVEHTNNMLLLTDLAVPGSLRVFAGSPDPGGGFADGPALFAPQARFDFTRPVTLAATGDLNPIVIVPDPGNHSIRFVQGGSVFTVAGFGGAADFLDGAGMSAGFDTPVSVSLRCSGSLLVSESGAVGAGGHRLRELVVGTSFGGLTTVVSTLVGDGAPATVQGTGLSGSTFAPSSVFSTSESDIYWIDSGTGTLRRASGNTAEADCPLFADCSTAVGAGGSFTPGGAQSLTQTAGGRLFVVDYDPGGGVGTLFEVTP